MKKIISLILSILIAFNFWFYHLNFHSHAELMEGILEAFIGSCLDMTYDKYKEQHKIENINESALKNGDFIQLKLTGDGYKFYANTDGASDEDVDFRNYIANYLNRNIDQSLIESFNVASGSYNDGMYNLSVGAYKTLKNKAIQGFESYLNWKSTIEGGDTLTEVDGLASYNFDFVGPLPYMTLPTSSGYVQADVKGFHLMTPHPCTEQMQVERTFASIEQAKMYGAQEKILYSNGAIGNGIVRNGSYTYENSYIGNLLLNNVYAWGYYIIYNGELFYHCTVSHIDTPYKDQMLNAACEYSFNSLGSYFNSHSISLQAIGCRSYIGLNYGIYYATQPVTSDFPMDLLEDDIKDSIGGTIDIDRTPEEDIIGQGMAVGILDPNNSKLMLDDKGNIIGADGLTLDKILDLLNKLTEGQIEFEDFQGYLQQIIQLLAKSNTNTSTIEKITQNILTYEKKIAGSFVMLKAAMEGCKAEMAKHTSLLTSIVDFLNPEKIDPKLDPPKVPIINKFPFSLPWDFYNLITIFVVDEKPPIFKVPIKAKLEMGLGAVINEEITLDLTQFKINGVDMVRAISRSAFIIIAVLGLIFATRKLIWK